jgi:hypothetical protein
MNAGLALLLAPLLALADQGVAYALVGWSCASQNHAVSHGVHLAFLLATLATMAPAWRSVRVARGMPKWDEGDSGDRRRFIALCALLTGAICAAAIVAMWIPQWVLPPCLD